MAYQLTLRGSWTAAAAGAAARPGDAAELRVRDILRENNIRGGNEGFSICEDLEHRDIVHIDTRLPRHTLL